MSIERPLSRVDFMGISQMVTPTVQGPMTLRNKACRKEARVKSLVLVRKSSNGNYYAGRAHKCHTYPTSATVSRPIMRKLANQYGNDQMRCCHENASPEKQRASSKPIHRPQAANYADELAPSSVRDNTLAKLCRE